MSRCLKQHVARLYRPQTEKYLTTNQLAIDPKDMYVWRKERETLFTRVSHWCRKNNIYFTLNPNEIKLLNGENKIIQMWLCDLLPPMEYWHVKNKQLQQLGVTMFVFTDNFIELEDLEFVKFYSDPTLHAIFGSYQDTLTVNSNTTKLYNCFMQRIESVRQSWFYFLHHKGLLEKGYVSFLLYQLTSYSSITGVELFDHIHHNYHLDQLPHFHEAYMELRSQVPYKNFPEIQDLTPYIQDSKYSLVLETYATDPATDRWLISEKAIRAMCFPSIPLLFMQTQAVKKLQSIGFQIDHHDSIDAVPWQQRQQQLLEILEQDSIDFDATIAYNRSMYNRDVCAKLQQQYRHPTYFDKFFTQVLEH